MSTIGYEDGGKPLTLFDKIWQHHVVGGDGDGADTALIYIDRHLVHEVTSPQAFDGLRASGRPVRRPDCTLSTADHNVPTTPRDTYTDAATFIKEDASREQVMALESNVAEFGIRYWGMDDARQGIVHVIGPEQGFTLPGVTLVCGDSHTSTHGAFGAYAFGIGTSEVEHTLATQTLVLKKSKNMRIQVNGKLDPSCTSKDVVLHICGVIGTAGGTGHVMEFCGSVIEALSMEARMSMCNMSIEAGARAGLVAPDEITFAYCKGKPMAPSEADGTWDKAVAYWKTLKSDPGAVFDKTIIIDGDDILPTVTWGTSPEDTVAVTGVVPDPKDEEDPQKRDAMIVSLEYMGLTPGTPMDQIKIDYAFIGSCTNSRIEDIRAAATVAKGNKVAAGVRALIVPGSGLVKQRAEAEGLDKILIEAGFEFREPGCSMCLAMNPDKLKPGERCAATSNRNFQGRQGPGGRTHLMSPAMAAAAAIKGTITDVRKMRSPEDLAVSTAAPLTPAVVPAALAYPDVVPIKPTNVADGPAAVGLGKFTKMSGVSAPMDLNNVDTDKIIPARFLKTIKRTGLGVSAFADLRYNEDGTDKPEFVLNKPAYSTSKFLICGDNFGCGSSREHAPWALKDWGLMCVISTSFADIFKSNCYKNGMLPVVLPYDTVRILMADAENKEELSVDLEKQELYRANGDAIAFEIDPFLKHCLVNGLDQIGLTLQKKDTIATFETARSQKYPWLDGMGYKGVAAGGGGGGGADDDAGDGGDGGGAAAGAGDVAEGGGVDAAKRAEALAPPAEGDVPTPGASHIIYDDDAAIGKKAPTLGTLDYIKGEPVVMGKGKPVCIVFWSKAYKGDYTTLRDVSKIHDVFGDDIQFLGIGIDPTKADSESFLKKIGTKMKEIYINQPLKVNFPLAYDTDMELKGAYKDTAKMLSLGASAVFLVDGDRNIVWREQFAPAPGHLVTKGQLQEQCRRLILGEALVSNGNRPVEAEEEEEEMDMGGGDDDFDW